MQLDSQAIDALVLAAVGTASLLLVGRSIDRFRLSRETRAWMGLAWLLIFVALVLVYNAARS